jgi:outer membrane immunogenic protein
MADFRCFARSSIFAVTLALAPVASAESWTGFSFGVGGGYGMANHEFGLSPGPALDGAPFDFGLNIDGLGGQGGFFTIGAGYDRQITSSIVVGAFIDYDFSNIETDISVGLFGGAIGANAGIEVENQLSIGARLGYLVSPHTLFFTTAGYAHVQTSDLDASVSFLDSSFPVKLASVGSFNGYFVGGGVETKLSDRFSIKAEYRYTQLNAETLSILPGTGIGEIIDEVVTTKLEPTIQSVRVSLNYRLDHGDGATAAAIDTTPNAVTSWTGGYVGVGTGYSAANNEVDLSVPPGDDFLTVGIDGFGHQGGFIALSAGYDYQIRPQVVIGAFVDFDMLNLKHQDSLNFSLGDPAFFELDGSLTGKIRDMVMIGGRIGYLASPDTLLFGSFGYANADFSDVRIGASVNDFPLGSLTLVDGKRYSGYFLGGGVETRLSDEISLKAEYRYIDLGSENVTLLPDVFPEVNEFVGTKFDPAIQTGRVSINYRFNGPERSADPLK